jgi:hypothetical protein
MVTSKSWHALGVHLTSPLERNLLIHKLFCSGSLKIGYFWSCKKDDWVWRPLGSSCLEPQTFLDPFSVYQRNQSHHQYAGQTDLVSERETTNRRVTDDWLQSGNIEWWGKIKWQNDPVTNKLTKGKHSLRAPRKVRQVLWRPSARGCSSSRGNGSIPVPIAKNDNVNRPFCTEEVQTKWQGRKYFGFLITPYFQLVRWNAPLLQY